MISKQLEQLERRDCPSCTAVQSAVTGAVTVRGDNAANVIEVVDHGDATADVSCDANDYSFTDVSRVTVSARGGNDTVTYSTDADLGEELILKIDLGTGNDLGVVNLSDGNAINAGVHADIIAGSGNDDVDVSIGAITETDVVMDIDLSSGDDVLGVFVDGDLVGAVLQVDVYGGAGHDRVDVVSQDATGDPLPIGIDVDSLIDMILEGGFGNDDIYFDVTATDDSDGEAIIDVSGGRGNDILALLMFNEAGDGLPESLVIDLLLDGGTGFNDCDVVGDTPVSFC